MKSKRVALTAFVFMVVILQAHGQGMPDRQFERLLNRGEHEDQLRIGIGLHEGTSSDFSKNVAQGRQLIETVAGLGTNSTVRVRAVSVLLEIHVRDGNFDEADQLLLKEQAVNNTVILPFAGQVFLEAKEFHRAEDAFTKAFRSSGIPSEMRMRVTEQLAALYSNQDASTLLNYERGIEWAKRAEGLGSAYALGYLGYAYQTGQGVEVDDSVSFAYWLRAAERGNRRANFQVAFSYFAGTGVPINFVFGRERLEKAISARDSLAIFFKGQATYNGDFGFTADAKAAISLMIESYFAGYSPAIDSVYQLASNGVKVAQDYIVFLREEKAEFATSPEVEEWALSIDHDNISYELLSERSLLNVARSGFAGAQNFIGNHLYAIAISGRLTDRLFRDDVLTGEEQSFLFWFEKSAEQGFSDSNHALGLIYSDGVYVPKNVITALTYFINAYQQGDSRSSRAAIELLRSDEVIFTDSDSEVLSVVLAFLENYPELAEDERESLKSKFMIISGANSASDDLSERLRNLGNLYQEGLLSDEEFEAAKKLLLGL